MESRESTHTPAPTYSITALSVASGLKACAQSPKWSHLVDQDAAALTKHFIRTALHEYACTLGWATYRVGNFFPSTVQKRLLEYFTPTGYLQHCAMRKLFIEQTVREFLDKEQNKNCQVLVLGGGFDTLALRLHKQYPNTEFFEVDCDGGTRKTKLKAICTFGKLNPQSTFATQNDNLHFIGCDLSAPNWYLNFLKSNFDKNKNTIVIAEGLTMYLTEAEVDSLLRILKTHILNEDSSVIISFSEPKKTDSFLSKKLRSEANELYKCAIAPEEVPVFLKKEGFALEGKILNVDFQKQAKNQKALSEEKITHGNLVGESYYLLKLDYKENNKEFTHDINSVPTLTVKIPVGVKSTQYRSKCF